MEIKEVKRLLTVELTSLKSQLKENREARENTDDLKYIDDLSRMSNFMAGKECGIRQALGFLNEPTADPLGEVERATPVRRRGARAK